MELFNLKSLSVYLDRLIQKRLWLKVIIAICLGVGTGFMLSEEIGWVPQRIAVPLSDWLALPGNLFLKLVQMVMIPLIFASIITGIVSNSGPELRKMGLRVGLYFLFTTVVSITIGVTVANIVKPGNFMDVEHETVQADNGREAPATPLKDIPKSIAELLPDNPLASMVSGEMLSIVIFTMIVGIALLQIEDKLSDPIIGILNGIQEICMTVVKWAMRMVPAAVFGLMAQLTASTGFDSLKGVGLFMLTVLLGLLVLLIVYLILVALIGRSNPFSFLQKITDVQLLAFSTASSAAVMPLSLKTAEEKLQIKPSISNFIIPIGATVNMDGTAVFQCIATLFIAQTYGIEFTLVSLVLIMTTIVASSIGTPAIPGGGVLILATVLQSAGIPAEGVMLIIGVDRILGMFRTALNVTGDLAACLVFDRWMSK